MMEMGFFDRIKKKKEASFCMGIEDVFHLQGEKYKDYVVVVGQAFGTATVGAAAYITSPGCDKTDNILVTIDGIEINRQRVQSVSDQPAAFLVKTGKDFPIHKGSVVFTRDKSGKDIYGAYLRALNWASLPKNTLTVNTEDLENMTLTDLAEVLQMFEFVSKNDDKNLKKSKAQPEKKPLLDALAKKLLQAEEIFCLYHKGTGEPMMFSDTFCNDKGYICTPPKIKIVTKAYADAASMVLPDNAPCEWKKIENGADGKGIENFLGYVFYLNGAQAVQVFSNGPVINADSLVAPPSYDGIPEIQIPITNPDVVRWQLLMGQMEELKTKDEETIYSIYFGFLGKACIDAKFLVPMQKNGEETEPVDETGKTVFKEGTTIFFPTISGKGNCLAIRFYTDWKRLRMSYGDDWSGMIFNIDQFIDEFDIVVNLTNYEKAGCYIDKETYERMKNSNKNS